MPNSCNAPGNDLNFIQALKKYQSISNVNAKTATNAIGRHLWYLSGELAPLGFFSDLVTKETKHKMVVKLQQEEHEGTQERSVRYTGKEDLSTTTLDHFIGLGSCFFFAVLQMDNSFLPVHQRKENCWVIKSDQCQRCKSHCNGHYVQLMSDKRGGAETVTVPSC